MRRLLAIVSCFIILFSLFASVNSGIMARASGTVSTVDILNASNTYNLATDKKGEAVIGTRVENGRDNSTQYYLSYDLTRKNERRVSDKTSVTIFTPGLIWVPKHGATNRSLIEISDMIRILSCVNLPREWKIRRSFGEGQQTITNVNFTI